MKQMQRTMNSGVVADQVQVKEDMHLQTPQGGTHSLPTVHYSGVPRV